LPLLVDVGVESWEEIRRSAEPVTDEDLARPLELADEDMHRLPAEWHERRAGVFLAQGAAQHFVDGQQGVKDFDVWTFYWSNSSMDFPWKPPRKRHVDFGRSTHGRNVYSAAEKADRVLGPKIKTWERFLGRRVDLMTRTLEPREAGIEAALRAWLSDAASLSWKGPKKMTSAWWLSRRPVVGILPRAEVVVWNPPVDLPSGIDPLPLS
jgi:hypothetical protein